MKHEAFSFTHTHTHTLHDVTPLQCVPLPVSSLISPKNEINCDEVKSLISLPVLAEGKRLSLKFFHDLSFYAWKGLQRSQHEGSH